jgi:hypothetical protein
MRKRSDHGDDAYSNAFISGLRKPGVYNPGIVWPWSSDSPDVLGGLFRHICENDVDVIRGHLDSVLCTYFYQVLL